jgi:hypothetical protein
VVTTVLGPNESPGGLSASNRTLVWIVAGQPSTVTVRDLDTAQDITIESEPEGLFGYPVAADTYVAWAESSGTATADVGGYLLHTQTGTLNTIGNTAGLYAITGNGDIISWQDSATPEVRREDIVTTVAKLH